VEVENLAEEKRHAARTMQTLAFQEKLSMLLTEKPLVCEYLASQGTSRA
jgi:hypothetical protein